MAVFWDKTTEKGLKAANKREKITSDTWSDKKYVALKRTAEERKDGDTGDFIKSLLLHSRRPTTMTVYDDIHRKNMPLTSAEATHTYRT